MKYAIAIFCAIAVMAVMAAAASTNGQHAAEAAKHLTKLKTKESMYKAASTEALQEIRLAEKSLQGGEGVTALIQTSASAQDGTESGGSGDEARIARASSDLDFAPQPKRSRTGTMRGLGQRLRKLTPFAKTGRVKCRLLIVRFDRRMQQTNSTGRFDRQRQQADLTDGCNRQM